MLWLLYAYCICTKQLHKRAINPLTCSFYTNQTLERPPGIGTNSERITKYHKPERNGNGTSSNCKFWNWNGINSSFGEKNGMDQNSKKMELNPSLMQGMQGMQRKQRKQRKQWAKWTHRLLLMKWTRWWMWGMQGMRGMQGMQRKQWAKWTLATSNVMNQMWECGGCNPHISCIPCIPCIPLWWIREVAGYMKTFF